MLGMPYYHDFVIVFEVLQVLFKIFSLKKGTNCKKILERVLQNLSIECSILNDFYLKLKISFLF